ncbi:MAG: amidohydrolase, partial [Halanaerobiales bacterium]
IPQNADVHNYPEATVIPVMIDAHTHLGIGEEGIGWEGRDYNETTDPITPHLRAIDAINPDDQGFKDARQNGITTVMASPGSANILGGESLALKTRGHVVDEMVVKSPVGIKAAFGENPKRVYKEKDKSPTTRMAIAAEMRQAFQKTEDYLESKNKKEEDDSFERDIKWESLGRVLRGEIPLKAHAHRADDIMTALRISREFGFDLTIEHCTEGHLIARELAEAGVYTVVGPSLSTRSKVELKKRDFKTAAVLVEAGIKVAVMSDHPVIPVDGLNLYAALSAKAGLKREEALKTITINPAEILGIADRVGSIEKDKDADIAIFSGDPLSLATEIAAVYIEGDKVEIKPD